MLTNFKRALHFAFMNFWRNKGMSVAAIFILTLTTLLVTGLFVVQGFSKALIETVQNKIDITAYFKSDTKDQDILAVRDVLLKASPGIKNIQYVSAQDALNDFTQKHQDNPVLAKALTEVGDNPFLPALNITTNGDPALYQEISNVLQSDQWADIVDKVDFSQKKATIETVFAVTNRINQFAIGISVVLILISILVVLNTIKLVIDSSSEELNTMRIVGASDWFIKAPFIIEGALFGLISFVICLIISLSLAYFLTSSFSALLPGFSLFAYLVSHLWLVILIQAGFAIALGTFASSIVVGKYVKI